ncbi:uncharacterized protein [Dermacentor albipictus]|uniref:uncharacterized protein n=1 Tax=Dermacentor albipictus TaxID=60249 RepID=UPI0038FD340F
MDHWNLPIPWNNGPGITCYLQRHREAINRVLLGAGLEVCEDIGEIGCTRLAVIQNSTYSFPQWANPDDPVRNAAFGLANHLLTHYPYCFNAVEVYSTDYCTDQARHALSGNPGLKSLTLYLLNDNSLARDKLIRKLIKALPSLEELIFKAKCYPLPRVDVIIDDLVSRRFGLLATLDVAGVRLSPPFVTRFVFALLGNCTITNLGVGGCVYRAGPPSKPGQLFACYLTKRTATLKKLTLRGDYVCQDRVLWGRLTAALSSATTLEELTVDVYIGCKILPEVTALFAEVAGSSPSLAVLQLPLPE